MNTTVRPLMATTTTALSGWYPSWKGSAARRSTGPRSEIVVMP